MKQKYHSIIKPTPDGGYVGWVEEVPGTITCGHTLAECRHNLRDALQIMLETIRSEARIALDDTCILENVEIDMDQLIHA